MMENNVSIIGGDLRIVRLAKMLKDEGFNVYTYGLENANDIQDDNEITMCGSIEEVLEKSYIIISAIPFSKNGVSINSPFSEREINIEDIANCELGKKRIFFAGSLKENIFDKLSNCFDKVIDVMRSEELTILNTIATAEGTIDIAIKEKEKNLQGSSVLVLGFGRVAKVVAQKFKALGAEITCAARKEKDLAWIKTYGYNCMNINFLNERLSNFDIIINTVPEIIIGKRQLKFTKSDVLIIDLASAPGGIDFEEAKKQKKKCIWALGIPGKIAPVSSAEFIKAEVYKNIENLF